MNPRTLTVTTSGDRELVFSRVFAAPRQLVFDCWTKPELLKRWFGPPGWNLDVCEIDLRVGGRYRFVMKADDGQSMGFGGTYFEVVVPALLVADEQFDEPWYEGEATVRMDFDEQDGRTTWTETVRYDSQEIRDGVIGTGAADGLEESLERLAEYLAAAG
jgi:uncharacterized protein YndB with AHSA1/START domain